MKERIVKIGSGRAWRRAVGAAGAVAIAVSPLLTGTAAAEPDPKPSTPVPDPQGPGCDAFQAAVPDWKDFAGQPVGTVLAGIPDLSTFNALISGQANPDVDVVPVFNNGPYVVFAPSNEAYAALAPGRLDAITADPAALTQLAYYHAFLGLLGPDQVHGRWSTQDGAPITVEGKGGDLTVNDTAKNVCGGISAANAQIYIIDAVLDPVQAPVADAEAPVPEPTDG